MEKVRAVLLIGLVALLMGCENIFAPPKAVPAPPEPEAGIGAPEPEFSDLAPPRVYLAPSVSCSREEMRFTLYNPTDAKLTFGPASPKERTMSVIMNGQPMRKLAEYCGVSSLVPGASVDCVRSFDNDVDIAGFSELGMHNRGSAFENIIEVRAAPYYNTVSFGCGGNQPNYAVTELGCSDGKLRLGIRNIFDTPLYLGTPVANSTSQYEYLHLTVNERKLMALDTDCGAAVLQPGETANCHVTDAMLASGTELNGWPKANIVEVRHKLYTATAKFPCEA